MNEVQVTSIYGIIVVREITDRSLHHNFHSHIIFTISQETYDNIPTGNLWESMIKQNEKRCFKRLEKTIQSKQMLAFVN